MPLQRYGTGFLKGLAQVAGQAKADLRDKEDTDSRNNLAMAQLALQSGDPVLIQGALDRLTDDFGGKPGAGGKRKAGGAGAGGDPKSIIAQALIGGLDRDEGGSAAQGPLRLSTPEETAGREQAASARRVEEAGATTGAQQAAKREENIAVARWLVQQFGMDPQDAMIQAGAIEAPQAAPTVPNAQTMMGTRPDDPPGTPPRLFTLDRPTGQWRDSRDNQLVTGEIQQRRAPRQPLQRDPLTSELNRRKIAALDAVKDQEDRFATIPDNYRDIISEATRGLTASAQASTQAEATGLWEQGDLVKLQRLIRNTVLDEIDPNTRRQVEGREAAIQELTKIRALFEELATDSVNADGTLSKGITTGRWEGAKSRGMRWAGRSLDPRLTRLTARINTAVIAYRSAVSGAAFTAAEGEAYEALFPSIDNTWELNMALIESNQASMRSISQAFWNGRLGPLGSELIGVGEGSGGDDAALRLRARQWLLSQDPPASTDSRNIDMLLTVPEAEWDRR